MYMIHVYMDVFTPTYTVHTFHGRMERCARHGLEDIVETSIFVWTTHLPVLWFLHACLFGGKHCIKTRKMVNQNRNYESCAFEFELRTACGLDSDFHNFTATSKNTQKSR